jgi:hypothetical protein
MIAIPKHSEFASGPTAGNVMKKITNVCPTPNQCQETYSSTAVSSMDRDQGRPLALVYDKPRLP